MSHTYNPKLAENIQVASACGLSPKAIAKEFGLQESTLLTHYREDLDHGLEVANAKVAKVFFDLAISGEHPSLTAKWMELRANWASSQNLTITNVEEESEIAREKLLKLMNRTSAASVATSASTKLKAIK
jgi:DNA-binding NarL/FixJ family response regulator